MKKPTLLEELLVHLKKFNQVTAEVETKRKEQESMVRVIAEVSKELARVVRNYQQALAAQGKDADVSTDAD